jgi:hypothetical protein
MILQMRRVKFKVLSDPELLGTASLESPPVLLSGQDRTDGFCAWGGAVLGEALYTSGSGFLFPLPNRGVELLSGVYRGPCSFFFSHCCPL